MEEVYQWFLDGKVDIQGAIYYSEENEKNWAYPVFSCGYTYTVLLANYDNTEIVGSDYETFDGCTVGMLKTAKNRMEQLNKFCKTAGIKLNIVGYEQDELYDALYNNKVDLLLHSDLVKIEGTYVATKFAPQEHFIVVQKENKELLRELNNALALIRDIFPNYPEEIYEKHIGGSQQSLILTETEKDYIRQKGIVNVAVKEDARPLQYFDENTGEFSGIVADVFQLISEDTGIQFRYIVTDDYAERGRSGAKIDLYALIQKTTDSMEYRNILLSSPYMQNSVMRIEYRNQTDKEELLCVQNNDYQELFNQYFDNITYVQSYLDCFKMVNEGKADFTFQNDYVAQYILNQNNNRFDNISIVMQENLNTQLCIGFADKSDVILISIIEKAINVLKESDVNEIIMKSSADFSGKVSLLEYISANPVSSMILFALVFVIVVIVISKLLITKNKTLMLTSQIKEQKEQEEKLTSALNWAKEANQAKSAFLSKMSHEIRTPMNGIIGMTEIAMQAECVDGKVKKCLEHIDVSSQHLLSLVNSIIDMAKIEHGDLEYKNEIFSLDDIVKETAELFTYQWQKKNITFECVVDYSAAWVIGDKLRLKQVLSNLLFNAFKFTGTGGNVTLSIKELKKTQQDIILHFCVTDDGIGIANEDQERIFEAFEQVDVGYGRKNQGTGVGLAISQSIIKDMGGTLTVKSELGYGSKFCFLLTFPLGSELKMDTEVVSAKEDSFYDFNGICVMLAEDNELNTEIVKTLLEQKNCNITIVGDGEQAVAFFKNSKVGYYSLILMDIQMPVMDGLEATKAIRRLDRKDASKIPIVALSANAYQEDIKKALSVGLNDYIAKPFHAKELYEKIIKFCK